MSSSIRRHEVAELKIILPEGEAWGSVEADLGE